VASSNLPPNLFHFLTILPSNIQPNNCTPYDHISRFIFLFQSTSKLGAAAETWNQARGTSLKATYLQRWALQRKLDPPIQPGATGES
jgi:hypothetical protein